MKQCSTPYVIRKVQFFLIECFIDFRSVGNNYLYLCFIFHLTGRKDKCYNRDFSLSCICCSGFTKRSVLSCNMGFSITTHQWKVYAPNFHLLPLTSGQKQTSLQPLRQKQRKKVNTNKQIDKLLLLWIFHPSYEWASVTLYDDSSC